MSAWRLWLYVRYGKNVIISPHAKVSSKAVISAELGGEILIKSGCEVEEYVVIKSYGGDIHIGESSFIGPSCVIYGHGGLTIGRYVKIAAHCVVIPSNHNNADINEYIYKQGETTKGIEIEDDVWIGSGVRVLDGVCIKKGSVIGAGAVVTKSTETYGVYAGIPARKIRSRLNSQQ